MRTLIRRHLTYANVMATIAVFVALGGSGFAAGYVITRSSQIKDGAVTGRDLKAGAIDASRLADGAVSPQKLSATALARLAGRPGPQGPAGAAGAPGQAGAKGDAGADGTALAYAYVAADGTLDADRSWGMTQAYKSQVGPGLYCVRVDDGVAPVLDESTWLAAPLGTVSATVPIAVAQDRGLGSSWCPIPHPTLGENWIGVRTYALTGTGPQAADWGFSLTVP